jgi:hypothetical protein
VATADTRTLIIQAVERLQDQVPSLKQLKLVIRLELRARGAAVRRDPAGDARIDVTVNRPEFNELAAEGTLRDWVDAYERGHVRVTGDPAVTRLLANVIQRQLARA